MFLQILYCHSASPHLLQVYKWCNARVSSAIYQWYIAELPPALQHLYTYPVQWGGGGGGGGTETQVELAMLRFLNKTTQLLFEEAI